MEVVRELQAIIEVLRKKMHDEAGKQGSFTHQNVVELSQQLDKYILLYQKRLSTADELLETKVM